MASISNLKIYSGNGHPGVFNDPANWSQGVAPGTTDSALYMQSAVVNGPVEVNNLMFIGSETIAINGAIKTDSPNGCESFMVCQQANVTFDAGSSLTDAGGFEVGVHGVGSVTVAAASGGHAAATLSMHDIKVGQFVEGVGTLTLAGGAVSVVDPTIIGDNGQGTLNMSGTATLTTKGLSVGLDTGGTGQLNLTGSSSLAATSWMKIGDQVPGAIGGIGKANIATGASLSSRYIASVGAGSTVNLAGGTFSTGGMMQIGQGGTVSGFGTAYSAVTGVSDNGVIASAGGTLVVTGNVSGMGTAQIGANSTLDLVASKINLPSIAFMGTGATLELATGVSGTFAISGFGAGDHLLMSGIDHADWSASTNVLSLSEHGQVLDKLTMTGIAAGASFSVTPGIGGSIIALVPSHH